MTLCTYDGCPYPDNPRYDHNHPATAPDLEQIKQREQAAVKGPWEMWNIEQIRLRNIYDTELRCASQMLLDHEITESEYETLVGELKYVRMIGR